MDGWMDGWMDNVIETFRWCSQLENEIITIELEHEENNAS
jgi:hypothetical protein